MALYTAGPLGVSHATGRGPGRQDQLTQVGRALDRLGHRAYPAYRPKRAAAVSGSIARSRIASSTSSASHRSPRGGGQRLPAGAVRAAIQRRLQLCAGGPGQCVCLDRARGSGSDFCHQEDRVVGRDNTVSCDGHGFQLARQPGRRSCEGLRVTVRRHLNGEYRSGGVAAGSVTIPPRSSGRVIVARRWGLWKLPVPWTPRPRPPHLGKRPDRVFHSYHRPLYDKAVRSLVKQKRTDHLSTTLQTPNFKLQTSNSKLQTPKKLRLATFGVWSLTFGVDGLTPSPRIQ